MTVLSTSRQFDTSPDAIFAAIRDPARLARWWGPNGFTNTFDLFEFRPGGLWTLTMHGPDGMDYPNQSEFAEIEPNTLVRIRHVSEPHFVLTITLTPHGGGTLVSWDQDFANPAVAEKVRAICEPANEQNLDRLERELKSGA